jgi:hypothetical protein
VASDGILGHEYCFRHADTRESHQVSAQTYIHHHSPSISMSCSSDHTSPSMIATASRSNTCSNCSSKNHRALAALSPLEDIKALLPSFASSSSSSSSASATFPEIPSFLHDPIIVGVLSAVGGIGLALGGVRGYRRYWKRIRNSNDITGGMLDSKRWIKGVVTR